MWLMRKYKILNIYSINFKYQDFILQKIKMKAMNKYMSYNYEGDINQMTIIFLINMYFRNK